MDSDLNIRFAYHQPSTQSVIDAHELVRNEHLTIAKILSDLIPPGRELALALTKLEESMMWANAGIARNQGVANDLANKFFESE